MLVNLITTDTPQAVTETVQAVAEQVETVVEQAATSADQAVAAATEQAAVWGWSEMLWCTLISVMLVFGVLLLLVFVMKLFGVIFAQKPQRKLAKVDEKPLSDGLLHEEEIAAITTALKLYKSALHDRESEVLTIMNVRRAYSPWNSKIHGLTQLPDKK